MVVLPEFKTNYLRSLFCACTSILRFKVRLGIVEFTPIPDYKPYSCVNSIIYCEVVGKKTGFCLK